MGKMDGILLCTDLDGTLLGRDGRVSPENLRAIEYFKKEGKVVVVEGQSEPEESYQNMINAFKTSNIKGLKEFIEG